LFITAEVPESRAVSLPLFNLMIIVALRAGGGFAKVSADKEFRVQQQQT
jgi:hypothetical protein